MEKEVGQGQRQNRIGLAKQLEGVRWLQEHREEAGRVPQTELAQTLSQALGCRVTVGNLGTMAGAAGVLLHGYAREEVLEARVTALEERVERLAGLATQVDAAQNELLATVGNLAKVVKEAQPVA